MKTSKNCYLPGYDGASSRWELAAFSGLGLAGMVLIIAAGINGARFAVGRERIGQALCAGGAGQGAVRGGLGEVAAGRELVPEVGTYNWPPDVGPYNWPRDVGGYKRLLTSVPGGE